MLEWAHTLDCPVIPFLSRHRGQMWVLRASSFVWLFECKVHLYLTNCSHQLTREMHFLLVKLHSASSKHDLGRALWQKERKTQLGWNLAECGLSPCLFHWPPVKVEVEGRKTWTESWMVCWGGQERQPEQRHVLFSGNPLRGRPSWGRLGTSWEGTHCEHGSFLGFVRSLQGADAGFSFFSASLTQKGLKKTLKREMRPLITMVYWGHFMRCWWSLEPALSESARSSRRDHSGSRSQ